jgi:predicted enzyme related to lactoylglutathione lyase
VPPVWSVSFHAPDVDAACARVTELGGHVGAPPMDIPGTGRMAIVADPQGAGFVLWEPNPFAGAAIVNEPGAWAWNDLQCNDPVAAAPFYEALFGWSVSEVPGSDGVYHGVVNAGRRIGGIMRAPAPVERPFWMTYVGAADVDATIAAVQAAGGRQVTGPIAVPAGRFAVVADPQDAVFALVDGEFDD